MYIDNVDAAYLEKRLGQELKLAEAATNLCARLAHEALANGYRHKLAGVFHRTPGQSRAILRLAHLAADAIAAFPADVETGTFSSGSAQATRTVPITSRP